MIVDHLLQTALEHHQAGRLQEAAESYSKILKIEPNHARALYLFGLVAYQGGHPEQAVKIIRKSLSIERNNAECYNVIGLALSSLGKTEEATENFQRAINLEKAPEFYTNLGNLMQDQGRADEAIAAYRQALERDPNFANANYSLGNALRAKHELEQAAECFQRAVDADATHANACAALGQTLLSLRRSAEAVPVLQKAVSLLPEDAELHCGLADALQSLGQLREASAEYRKAFQLDPQLGRAWYAFGCLESSRDEYANAVFAFRKALEIQPQWPQALHNLGEALFGLGQVDEALQQFERAAASGPPKMPRSMIAVIVPGSPKADNQAILEARRAYAELAVPATLDRERFASRPKPEGRPLRVGYISSFFHRENWMKPVWGLVKQHDRSQFEIHLFSDAPLSAMPSEFSAHPEDRFHEIGALSNEAAAAQIEASGIDLLIDLNGYSKTQRLPLFGLRPAPVIVGWFNLYATTGMRCYDYLIGDDVVIPPEEERFYTEKIVRVPGSYLTFEVGYPTPDIAEPPALANGVTTFGCLGPQYKITNDVIATWSRILREAPDSRLLLKNSALGSPGARRIMHGVFGEHGIAAERIRLEGPADHFEFLKTYGEIDIALDTFPYNGGTTTMEALWQGVPVVAFPGDRWVSRISASLLSAAGLDQFVAPDLDGYVSLAVELAKAPRNLTELRSQMRERLSKSSVCDTQTFARNMERLYLKMF